MALIEAGAGLDYCSSNGETLLHYAAAACSDTIVSKLIDEGVNVNALSRADKWGGTPLHSAARAGNCDAISPLVDGGADLYAEYDGRTALEVAIQSAATECVRILLDAGYAVDHAGAEGRQPLQWACFQRAADVEDIPLNDPGIIWSEEQEKLTEIAEILLAAGADVNAADIYDLTALFYASSDGPVSRVALLIEAGADVNAIDSEGATPLLYAVRRFDGQAEVASSLLQAGADPNAGKCFGWQALHWAAAQCPLEVTQLLITAGAEVNARSTDGVSALQLALNNPDPEVREALVAAGAH